MKAAYFTRQGDPAHQILDFVRDWGADLLVMSTHGHTGLEHFLLGSVTEKVVRSTTVPVFVVKSFGRSLVADRDAPADETVEPDAR